MMWALAMTAMMSPSDATWTPIPLVTKETRAAGYNGGEGAQWPRGLAVSPDGQFLLFAIDVGGIYRSLNAGRTWEPANVGYSPRGACAVAIDPYNPKRCFAVAANSAPGQHHGIYLSTDQAASWRNVLPANTSGNHDMREQLAFDPTTYDKKKNLTRVVYWSRISGDKATWGTPEEHPALYKSSDGGETWQELPNSSAYGGSILRHHPLLRDVLYAANRDGVHRSVDGGRTFARVLEGEMTGLDVSPSAPDALWASRADGVWRSNDGGKSWKPLDTGTLKRPGHMLQNVKVSPADPDRIVLWRNQEPNTWEWARFASDDGGRTWRRAKVDATHAFLPQNARQGIFAWDPNRANVVWSVGGDWVTKSTDGGNTYRWAADGYNAVLVGGMWNFNVSNPDLMFFGSQDYNGAMTKDGGNTWSYINPSGNGWGGYCYGGYAASASLLVVGNAPGWGGPRTLRVSRDGGKAWIDTGVKLGGIDAALSDPGAPKVVFASDHRSGDGGATWRKMDGCDGVLVAKSKSLYGVNRLEKGADVVVSRDHGATWTKVAHHEGEIRDVAATSTGRVFAVLDDRPAVWESGAWRPLEIPKNQFGGYSARTVAIDPKDERVVYVGSAGNLYSSSVAVVRSLDGGRSWSVLTRNSPLRKGEKDGGREALCIRVHPRTREAWVSTSCYGLWKVSKP